MTDLIADYERHLKRLDRAEATIASYIDTLRRMDRELPGPLITALPEELEDWLYNQEWSKATRHQRRAAVVGFFRFASSPKRKVRIDWNPAADLPPIKVPGGRPRPAPTSAVAALLRAREPFRTWYVLAAFTGARCCEIAALDCEAIGEEDTELHGKGDKTRTVPTHPLVWALAQVLPPGPVAVAAGGWRLTRADVSLRGNREIDRMGHAPVTMHRLRSWFGTQAYEASGNDIRAVQELLGHASVATTQIYVAPSRRGMARGVAGLPVPATR